MDDDADKQPDESLNMGSHLNMRIMSAQKAAYEKAARAKRKSLSAWIRETLDHAAESQGFKIE